MYKYGRGMWKTIEDGNELSWVVGNGIGGYANHTVAGGASQAFHGYLIASLNGPVNRKLILTRVQEQIIIKDREYDLTSQQYIGTSKNGQEYLEQFILDTVPEYRYRVEDVSINKTINLSLFNPLILPVSSPSLFFTPTNKSSPFLYFSFLRTDDEYVFFKITVSPLN